MGHDILLDIIQVGNREGIAMFNMLINAGANINENQKIDNNGEENSQKEKDDVRDQIHDDQNI